MNTPSLSTFLSRRRAATALASLLLCSVVPSAMADSDYPNKPIKLIIGYPPGGSVDQTGRIVGEALARRLKGTIVIENLGGAAGTIAAQKVVNSPADGYTVMVGSSNELVATGLVNKAQKYDAQRDMTPIGLIATAPVLLVAGPKVNVKTLAEFVDAVKRNPGKFSYGSSGVGSTLHFAGELIKQRAGLFMSHIPYRGVAPLTNDLAGGSIEFAIMSTTATIPFLQSGRLTALGVTSSKRLDILPNVPALGEHPLLKGYDLSGWFALMAPKGLPAPLVAQLKQALQETLQDPVVRKKLEDGGFVVPRATEDLSRLMAEETTKYAKLVQFAKITE